MSASTVFSGARAILKIGTGNVGYVMNCAGTTGINYQPLNVLGHLETVEHVPVAYTVEMTASMARVANVTRLNTGTSTDFPGRKDSIDGSANSPQIMPSFGISGDGQGILTSGELQGDVFDRVTGGEALYTIKGLKCSQKSWEIAAGSMVAENCTFVARIQGERGDNAAGTTGAN